MAMKFCIFSSTPDIKEHNFVVQVLTGKLEELLERSVDYGYDGIEFLPDPNHVPDPIRVQTAIQRSGGSIPVLNTGRLAAQGLTLLNTDKNVRVKSIEAFKKIIDVAGVIGAKVGLGMSRGFPDLKSADQLAEEVFRELTEHAEKAGATIMLEPADPGFVGNFITTVADAMSWRKRINSPNFTLMLDTYQLTEIEKSLEKGIEDAQGRANHIHFYDPSHWPPGVLEESVRLDWNHIASVLKKANFSGTGSVVLAPEGEPEVTAPKAVSFLRKFFD